MADLWRRPHKYPIPPLDQINASNFSKLEVAWRFKTDNLGNRPEYKLEGTPLMVNGVIYATAGTRRAVMALDAATGELLWMHGEHEGARGAAAPRGLSGRGLAYWTDGKQAHPLRHARLPPPLAGRQDRRRRPGFGDNGIVDLKQDDDQEIDLDQPEKSACIRARGREGRVIWSARRTWTGGVPKSKQNVKGYVRGIRCQTGKRLWIFHTIPRPGEFGYEHG